MTSIRRRALNADWRKLTREAGLRIEAAGIQVSCGEERSQFVQVDDSRPEVLRVFSVIVTRGDAERLKNAALEAWKMNRFRELVGFKVAEYGRVIGESWVPTIGLTADEWKCYVLTVARSCDRLEYLWTGRDVE